MSKIKEILDVYRAYKWDIETKRADEEYVNKSLVSHYKNAYYKACGNFDVYLRTPQMYQIAKSDEPIYLETGNIPTYMINFTSQEKAQSFMTNNFFMGPEHQKNVNINLATTIRGTAIIIEPINIDYEVHIEVQAEQTAQKLVRLFRRQYADNRNLLAKIQKEQQEQGQIFEDEKEDLGIEF